MKKHIAILAACAGTFALAQADVARANHNAAFASKRSVSTTEIGPEPVIVLARYVKSSGPGAFGDDTRRLNKPLPNSIGLPKQKLKEGLATGQGQIRGDRVRGGAGKDRQKLKEGQRGKLKNLN